MEITLIFWLPFALSVVGTVYYVCFTEESGKLKALAIVLTAAALVLQFGFMFKVHFMIPLLLQVTVSLWMAIYWKLNH